MYRVLITCITAFALISGCATSSTTQETTQTQPTQNPTSEFKFVVAVIDEGTSQPVKATISIAKNSAPALVTIAPTATITTTIGAILTIEVIAPGYKIYRQRYGLLG
jgi:uncharacterized lipoprotein YajG